MTKNQKIDILCREAREFIDLSFNESLGTTWAFFLLELMNEADIQNQILSFLRKRGYFHARLPLGGVIMGNGKFRRPNPMKGWPDIIGVFRGIKRRGILFGIEVKKKGGKQQPIQIEKEQEFKESGCFYTVAHCLDDVVDFLGKEDY